MSKKPTEQRHGDLFSDPDLVDRIFDYIVAQLPELAGRASEVKGAVRAEFAGEKAWVAKRSSSERQQLAHKVLAIFNGRNATEVCRQLKISRATVYRLLKQQGRST
jgi:Mor family transcriptional regulator